MRSLLLYIAALLATGCLEFKPGTATLKNSPSITVVTATVSQDGQDTTGTLSAGNGQIQTLSAPEGSAIEGVLSSFPPGAISLDTEITLSPGADITDIAALQSVGLSADNQVQSVGSSVSIESSVAFNTSVPFTVAITIDSQSLLLLDEFNSYAVVYKVKDVDTNSLKFGIIPAGEINIVDGKAYFSTKMFGTFQLVKTTIPIVVRQEAVVATLVADTAAEIEEAIPYVADSGKPVKITGKGFTGKMLVTVAGIPVRKLNVQSDVQASFIVPESVPFGFTTIDADQAGVKTSYIMLARSADKISLPLITMEPSGVCEGVSYYDANGNQQKGTKICSASGPTNATNADKAKTADSAAFANFAAYAEEAKFARGKKGSTITAAANLTIPADGDFFDVSGSTTIRNFGTGVDGQVIKLRFLSEVLVTGAKNAPKLILKDDIPLVTNAGMVLELVGIDGGWKEIGRSATETNGSPAFFGVIGLTGINHTFGGNDGTPQNLYFENVTFDPTHFSYDSTSNVLTPLSTRNYKIEMVGRWEEIGSTNTTWLSCQMGLEYSGNTFAVNSGYGPPNRCSFSGAPVTTSLFSTSAYRPYYIMSGSMGTPTGTVKIRSRSDQPVFIRITPN